ncbi:MAG: PfaD family polyunsaturated fatty acid/polyketide biosynthesis protein [Nitrospinota bacterium]
MNNLLKEHASVPGRCGEGDEGLFFDETSIVEAAHRIKKPLYIFTRDGKPPQPGGGETFLGEGPLSENGFKVAGLVPSLPLSGLGDASFCRDHGILFPYVAGGMANGITSVEIVESIAKAGMLAFFGAAGLSLGKIRDAVDRLSARLPDSPFGFNLIHNPNEPENEAAVVDLYIEKGIRIVEAAAYLDLTLPVVRYRTHGIHENPAGEVVTPNRILAKVSRVEVASKFFSPPPEKFLSKLVSEGSLTEKQAALARRIPLAQDITAEADSGGHTDNRPAITLVPTLIALKERIQALHMFKQKLRVGAAGGVATPASVSAMFAMGASYVLTGTVNQSCKESGSSDIVRKMLADASQADIAMAPSADMFEMGVKVQVLKRGTMFAMRASRLYDLYRAYDSIDSLPEREIALLEKTFFCAPVEQIWEDTKTFFAKRSPEQIVKAQKDPKHKMALLFRWYLGQSSHWANQGIPSRAMDFQIWCGPAIGAFNEWARGSFLEGPQNRAVDTVAFNLLYGAAVTMRLHLLKLQGVQLSAEANRIFPKKMEEIKEYAH